MTLSALVRAKRTGRDSDFAILEITASCCVKRVKRLWGTCGKGGRPEGGSRDVVAVRRSGETIGRGVRVSTQDVEEWVRLIQSLGAEHS